MKTFEIQKPFNLVFDAVGKALKELDIEFKADKKNKSISASKGVSIFSWGEEIQITFEEKGNSQTKIKIESISSAQLFDWWKNESNEEKIEIAIKKQISRK